MPKNVSERPLSKSKLISYRQCHKRFWLEVNGHKAPEITPSSQATFDDGKAVGLLAQRLYSPKSGAVVFEPSEVGYDEVITRTKLELNSAPAIFEAGFLASGVRVYVDVMLPVRRNGQRVWRMLEVKSAASEKEIYSDDVAIQAFIARISGVPLHSVGIVHINSKWVYQGDGNYAGYFQEIDKTQEVLDRAREVKQWIDEAKVLARARKVPSVEMGQQCKKPYPCPYALQCQSEVKTAKYPVDWLPSSGKNFQALIQDEGWTDMRQVPDTCLNVKQLRVKTHTLKKTTYFDEAATVQALSQHKLPAYFLDFETIAPPIPIWKGGKAFEKFPFQFSLHILSRTGKLAHKEFLDISGQDPSKKLAESLISACGEKGPIYVYSSFESTILKALAQKYPRLTRPLLAIESRLKDLMPLAKKYYYHPAQEGSWSIKKVLPTIAPELDYEDLDGVKDGGMAMLAYREALGNTTTANRKLAIERELLDYCRLDTLAMVRLWKFFSGRNDLEI